MSIEDRRHLRDILRQETTGGFILLAATVLALLWANLSPSSYTSLFSTHLGPLSIGHWISDGLLAVFFFVAGLELKREFVEGSLARPKDALVPIVAAICGMVIPAGIFVLINLAPGGRPEAWAIPMATDIAFALAVLAVAGPRLPTSVRAFLLTLAIVDDLGSIIVIAVAFTSSIDLVMLALSLAILGLWWLLQRKGIDSWPLYVLLFVAAWWTMHASGVHATIAGVLAGLATRCVNGDEHDPVNRAEHALSPWSAGVIVPLFALASAGVELRPELLSSVIASPVPLGIIAGLVLGKLLGVWGGSFLTAKITATSIKPATWGHYASTAQVAGIGFTVALLMAELCFAGEPELLAQAKFAVVIASVIAGIAGGVGVRLASRSTTSTPKKRREAASSVD